MVKSVWVSLPQPLVLACRWQEDVLDCFPSLVALHLPWLQGLTPRRPVGGICPAFPGSQPLSHHKEPRWAGHITAPPWVSAQALVDLPKASLLVHAWQHHQQGQLSPAPELSAIALLSVGGQWLPLGPTPLQPTGPLQEPDPHPWPLLHLGRLWGRTQT